MKSIELDKWARIISLVGGVFLILQGLLPLMGVGIYFGPTLLSLQDSVTGQHLLTILLGITILALSYKKIKMSDLMIGVLILVAGIVAGGWSAILAILGGLLYILSAVL